jgi:hypothetical protein
MNLIRIFALVLLALTLLPQPVRAGYIELSAAANYRKTHIADDILDENFSATGSVAYLLDASSAIELSYTRGEQREEVGASSGNSQIVLVDYTMAGLDFIYTFGQEASTIRPYVKLGGMYIIEKQRQTYYLFDPANRSTSSDSPALVPSAGLGFRLKLSESLSLKAGIDAWASKSVSQKGVMVDNASRVGLSWMF